MVYGGTPAGITAAVAAAREKASVVLIEPSRHVGGMITGGLSHTDVGKAEVIGGLALEFFSALPGSIPIRSGSRTAPSSSASRTWPSERSRTCSARRA